MTIPLNQFRQELYDAYQRAQNEPRMQELMARQAIEQQRMMAKALYGGGNPNPNYFGGGLAQAFQTPAVSVPAPQVEIDYNTDSIVIMGKRISRKQLEEMGPGTVAEAIAKILERKDTEKLRALQKDTLEQLNVLMSGEPKDHVAERFDGLIFETSKPEQDK